MAGKGDQMAVPMNPEDVWWHGHQAGREKEFERVVEVLTELRNKVATLSEINTLDRAILAINPNASRP